MKNILCLKSTFALFVVLLFLIKPALCEKVQQGVVMRGTRYETPYYIKSGAKPGPTLMVIGGLHGDEKAGYLAARKITKWKITSGSLIIMSDANREAIRRDVRAYPGNMNNMFPGKKDGTDMERLAYQIWQVIKINKPALLLTLHESRDFHANNPARFGQTFCFDFQTLVPLMSRVLKHVNTHISPKLHQFQIFVDPYPHCPTYNAWSRLKIPATSIETSRTMPLDTRVKYQLLSVQGFFDEFHLGFEQHDIPIIINKTASKKNASNEKNKQTVTNQNPSHPDERPAGKSERLLPKSSMVLISLVALGFIFVVGKSWLFKR